MGKNSKTPLGATSRHQTREAGASDTYDTYTTGDNGYSNGLRYPAASASTTGHCQEQDGIRHGGGGYFRYVTPPTPSPVALSGENPRQRRDTREHQRPRRAPSKRSGCSDQSGYSRYADNNRDTRESRGRSRVPGDIEDLLQDLNDLSIKAEERLDKGDRAYAEKNYYRAMRCYEKAESASAEEARIAKQLGEPTYREIRESARRAGDWAERCRQKHVASLQRTYEYHYLWAGYHREARAQEKAAAAYRLAIQAAREIGAFDPGLMERRYRGVVSKLEREAADMDRAAAATDSAWDMAVLFRDVEEAIMAGDCKRAREAFSGGVEALRQAVRTMPKQEAPWTREYLAKFVRGIDCLEARARSRFGDEW